VAINLITQQRTANMKHINIFLTALLLFLTFLIISCEKMDDTYSKYISDGPITYTGKADSLKSFGGNGRILLTWLLRSDQKITKCKVFWNFGGDSLEVAVTKTKNVDTIKQIIDNLREGSYNFSVYTFDNSGHKSVRKEVIGNVYGPNFMSTLVNRPIKALAIVASTSTVTVTWLGNDPRCVGTEWTYTGKDQLPKTLFSAVENTTVFNSCDVTKPISYRTVYTPEKNAVDKFYTSWKVIN
jgi:hypothetical protein